MQAVHTTVTEARENIRQYSAKKELLEGLISIIIRKNKYANFLRIFNLEVV